MADEQIDSLHIDISETGARETISSFEKLIADSTALEASLNRLLSQLNSVNPSFIAASGGAQKASAEMKTVADINFNKVTENADNLEGKLESVGKAAAKIRESFENSPQNPKSPEQGDNIPVPKPEKNETSGKLDVATASQLAKQLGLANGKAEGIVATVSKIAPSLAKAVPYVGLITAGMSVLAKFVSNALNETKKVATFMGNALKAGAEKAIEGIKGKIQSLTAPFEKLFDRIFRVALNRFLRFAMKQITDSFNTGMQNVARGMESANKVLSVYSTRLMYLKNTLGAAIIPLLQALTPLFLRVTNAVIKAADGINQFLSLLNGKTTYIKAKEQYVDYAASLDKSTKKAKKSIKNLTASFDELHDITETATSGDETDYTNYFTTAGIEADIDGFYKKILEGFQKGDLTQVGYILANKINESISKIYSLVSWDKVGEKVTRYARSLASLVTTLVNEVNFEQIALTFAEGLNTVVRAVNTFMEQLFTDNTFTNLGANLGMMLYTAITSIDWEGIGNFFLDKLIAVFDIAKGFVGKMIEKVDDNGNASEDGKMRIVVMIDKIFSGLNAALSSKLSKFDEFGQTVADFLVMIFEAGAALFGDTDFWQTLAKAINKVINKISENKDKIAESLKKFVKTAVGTIADFLKEADLSKLISSIGWIVRQVISDPEVRKSFEHLGSELGKIAGTWVIELLKTKIMAIPLKIETAFNTVIGYIDGKLRGLFPNITFSTSSTQAAAKTYGTQNRRAFATGGFPEDGLFLANHTELVGKFSNGKTAVANNEQIIEGVAGGVERGMLAAMSASGSNNGSGSNEYNFYIDAKKMAKALAKDVFGEANRAGLTLRTAKA